MTLSSCAQTMLISYHWPGNIRELSHLMERAVLLNAKHELMAADFPIANQQFVNNTLSTDTTIDNNTLPMMTLEAAEKTLIKQALSIENNHVPKAATLLGLTKSSLYRRLEKYDDIKK